MRTHGRGLMLQATSAGGTAIVVLCLPALRVQMLDVRVRMYLYRWRGRSVEDTADSSCDTYQMHVRARRRGPVPAAAAHF